MTVLWTTVAYVIVGGGALFAAFVLYKWMEASKRKVAPRRSSKGDR